MLFLCRLTYNSYFERLRNQCEAGSVQQKVSGFDDVRGKNSLLIANF